MDHFLDAITCTIIVSKRQKVTSLIEGYHAFSNMTHSLYKLVGSKIFVTLSTKTHAIYIMTLMDHGFNCEG